MKKETIEEAAEKYNDDFQIKGGSKAPHIKNVHIINHFIEGAKWQKNDCVQFIDKLEDESFDGWSEEAISGYLTACMTIKKQFKKK